MRGMIIVTKICVVVALLSENQTKTTILLMVGEGVSQKVVTINHIRYYITKIE